MDQDRCRFGNPEAGDQPDSFDDEWWEEFNRRSEIVARFEWTGWYGGCDYLRKFEGRWYLETETNLAGPFLDVEEVLELYHLNFPGTPEPRIWCPDWLLERRRLWKCAFNQAGDAGGRVFVNGRECLRTADDRLLAEPEEEDAPWEEVFAAEPDEEIETQWWEP